MIIEKILKQLTPERIKKEIEVIQKIKLPPELQKWVTEYEKVGERGEFVWKWTYSGWRLFTLSCVAKKYKKSVYIIKTCNTILNALIDDLSDNRGNEKFLNEALSIISGAKSDSPHRKNQKYFSLIKEIWCFIQKSIKGYPRYKEFKDIFAYDYLQFLNTMKYSYLINKIPNLVNLTEHEIYSSHNMQGIIGFTIDLMCSPRFDVSELGVLRKVGWRAQEMGRIGNTIATWEKEISRNDFTSGISAYFLEKKIIKLENLKLRTNKITETTILKARNYFLKKWEEHYNEILNSLKKTKQFDVNKILTASKKFLIMHLSCIGRDI
ncbi:MAG: hypothetical protein Q7K28_00290 [Candidatus Wildermuthbacteria bacterium]|nr:hypothetical protein [Candidatus Wildermuthbacteria bacterium]